MKVIGFIPSPDKAATIVSWAIAFAQPDDDLEFLCYEINFSSHTQLAVQTALSETGRQASLKAVHDQTLVKAVVEQLRKAKADLLVTCQFALPENDGISQNSERLITASPCRTFVTLYGDNLPDKIKSILYISTGEVHDRASLDLLSDIRKTTDAKITVASVEDNIGEEVEQAGESTIMSLLHDVGFDEESVEVKVVVDRLKHRGISTCFDGHDLVLAGMDAKEYLSSLENFFDDTTVAIVKRTPPLRLKSVVEWLPRINPSDHAELMHELRQGSVWGPDFIVMLGLAAAVSSLGLLQDSPAVVIGSMLLAPLMTPMMGLGLALAQANIKLMRLSVKSILP